VLLDESLELGCEVLVIRLWRLAADVDGEKLAFSSLI